MKTHYFQYTSIFTLICCSILISGCVFHGDIEAPNSYSIECDKGRDCIVFDVANHIVVVEPEVDKYQIVNDYLIGHTVLPAKTSIPATPQKAGYFIVNTRNGERSRSLSEKSWRQKLLKLGIKDPQLSDSWFENSK